MDNEATYVEGLRNMLTVVADTEKEIVITGDMNFDLKQSNKSASTKRFINMMKEFSLRQIIDNFTHITVIFNLTIELNVIPAEWKKAKVTPLHKSGPKDDPRNYRPISVLPVVSKVLERLIHNPLHPGYFDGHNLLCKSQSGFRRMHSTETAVTYFADEILMNMDKGLVTGSVFIDLAKAFDTVDHDILLYFMDIE